MTRNSPSISGTSDALPRGYLAAQSLAIAAWWATLALAPATRETFAPAAVGGARWLLMFLPSDAITAIGGAVAAIAWRRYAGRVGLVLCLIGISTQTLACWSVPLRTRGTAGWPGAVAMLAASVATLACAGLLVARTRAMANVFRPAPPDWTTRRLAWRTVSQAAGFWTLFLLVLPWSLSRVERAAGWTPPAAAAAMALRLSVGGALLVVAGAANVATARAMVRDGRGTPLPTRMARSLVTAGPYARVRNPMCVSALLQGLGVAVAFASPLTAFYVALGGVVWHVVVRPAEERDLAERFGPAYEAYRARVPLWLPRRRGVSTSRPGSAVSGSSKGC